MTESTLLESVVSRESVIRRNWLSIETAANEIVAFERRFGDLHLQLACHAAFPWIVNPELVNLIRINFLDALDVPWIADADFLLSRLCRPIGGGYFEADPRVREVLLVELEDIHGPGRLAELAEFVHGYTATPIAASQPPGTTQTQRWIALAYLAPEQLVSEMTATLHESVATSSRAGQMAGQLQVATTSEIVADPLEQGLSPDEYRDLRAGLRTIAFYWHGDRREAFRGLPATTDADGDELSEGAKQLALFIDWVRVAPPEPSAERPPPPPSERQVDPLDEPPPSSPEAAVPGDAETPALIPTGQFADLEIGIARSHADRYSVDLRLALPDSDDTRRRSDGLRIAIDELRQFASDAVEYGRRLSYVVFADTEIRDVLASAQAQGHPLRIRLAIDPNASELHGISWETLRDPETGNPLFLSERVLFSRYVSQPDWRPIRRRAKGDLRALVAVASPSDLERWAPNQRTLIPIDVASELRRAQAAFSGIAVMPLSEGDRTSLTNIIKQLRIGPDIFYLVCHAASIDGELRLWLEDDAGSAAVISAAEFLTQLRELAEPPRLIVLSSAQGPEPSGTDALGMLGPMLGEIGVPAVLTIPGTMSIPSAERFTATVMRELQRDGQIDRAVAVARGEIRDRPDAWAPILYVRLKSGRLWYESGFSDADRGRSYDNWQGLVNSILVGECTAVIGPGMADSLIGSRRDTALRLARDYRFPMAAHEQEDLPQVAQFVMQDQSRQTLVLELREVFRETLLKRLGNDVPPDLLESSTTNLDLLVLELGRRRWESNSDEPHRVLAQLPLKLYVTTAFDGLMTAALRAAGKDPREELFRWNDFADWGPSIYDAEPDYEPSPERPLVYSLFGHLGQPDSLVITEDDYMQFMVGMTRKLSDVRAIPGVVRTAFVNSSLLFLGFEVDGWDFRVLFRTLMDQGGKSRRRNYVHVMQQNSLEEGRVAMVDRAQRYRESYFNNEDIEIYWGSVADFTRDLRRHLPPEWPS